MIPVFCDSYPTCESVFFDISNFLVLAENVATQWGISRNEQDQFAVNSQHKAENAQKSNKFLEEITPLHIEARNGKLCCICNVKFYP